AAPGSGGHGGALLVGNFGDGRINAFDVRTGKFKGSLGDSSGTPITIEGLWGLAFRSASGGEGDEDGDDFESEVDRGHESGEGNGDEGHGHDDGHGHDRHDHERRPTLYFAAGIGDESQGLFGSLSPLKEQSEDRDDDHPSERSLQVALIHGSPASRSDLLGVQWRVSSAAPDIVSLRIYDASGRLIAEPMRGLPLSGSTVARWDLRDLRGAAVPAGMYFYRRTPRSRPSSRRLLFLPYYAALI